MSRQILSSNAARILDNELMSSGAYTIDQLMELAGLAVAKAIYAEYPPTETDPRNLFVIVGPGNNGGDGLVAARHLKMWEAYDPIIYFPKQPKNQLYINLMTQLEGLGIRRINSTAEMKHLLSENNCGEVSLILDAIFGFSFKPPIREPFNEVIQYLNLPHLFNTPIVSIDVPSGWYVDAGRLNEHSIWPLMLVSLTAPKPCSEFLINDKPNVSHYLGGRFINPALAEKYGIGDLMIKYKGSLMIAKLL